MLFYSYCRSLVEEIRKVLCALWRDGDTSLSPDSLFSIVWRLVPNSGDVILIDLFIRREK